MSAKSGSAFTREIDGETYSYVEEVAPGVSGWELRDPALSADTAPTHMYTCYSTVQAGVEYWQVPGKSDWHRFG